MRVMQAHNAAKLHFYQYCSLCRRMPTIAVGFSNSGVIVEYCGRVVSLQSIFFVSCQFGGKSSLVVIIRQSTYNLGGGFCVLPLSVTLCFVNVS